MRGPIEDQNLATYEGYYSANPHDSGFSDREWNATREEYLNHDYDRCPRAWMHRSVGVDAPAFVGRLEALLRYQTHAQRGQVESARELAAVYPAEPRWQV